ncbi:ornithine cyclodeaminase family protein [Legionella lytica]|uniref:Ornithine cyclodeaminase family protein n=1 Tax=Legionella lytica TaxID=96232 RepID=A0ABW8D7B0_9GAMM
MTVQLLSLNDVKQSINMLQAVEAMERAFIQLAENHVKLPLRTGMTIDEEQALTLTMPAYLAADKALGLKVVSIFPNNSLRNIPSITGFIMLLDAQTGEPKALMDAGYLTALRTGAVSGLATQYFAREDASHVAIVGSGVQAETQLEAVASVRDITRVSVWSRDLQKAQKFADKFTDRYEVKAYESIPLAVQEADIICTATGSNEPLIHLKDLQEYVHINAIGSHTANMKEIDNEVLGKAMVIADQLDAVLAESGEIMSAIAQQQLQPESIVELGTWLLHKNAEDKNRLTVFKSVGLSIQDVSVASVVYQNAIKKNLGTAFALS